MNNSAKLAIGSTLVALTLAVGGCAIEKEESGRLPDVDVQGGNMPEYDVKDADVDVGIEERSVPLPDVDVDTQR